MGSRLEGCGLGDRSRGANGSVLISGQFGEAASKRTGIHFFEWVVGQLKLTIDCLMFGPARLLGKWLDQPAERFAVVSMFCLLVTGLPILLLWLLSIPFGLLASWLRK